MTSILHLRGGNALSPFRLAKLKTLIQDRVPGMTDIQGIFWHFVSVAKPLSDAEHTVLQRILTYGTPASANDIHGTLLLVTPRVGTLSPWSSKATDIARNCGLHSVLRIERGIAYTLATLEPLSDAQRAGVLPLLHDRMTDQVFTAMADADLLFHSVAPRELVTIPLQAQGRAALEEANRDLGLALSNDEIDYLYTQYQALKRDPTDVELMMFAQANSEHCRHKIFNADFIIDGVPQTASLFGMIRTTHAKHPQGTVVAYSDNAAVMEGRVIDRFYPNANGEYGYTSALTHTLMKVETHNHPTAIAPYPGAATGSGGEIRDEGATGRGAKPKAGLTGFSVSNLQIPGAIQPWEEANAYGRPDRIASALQIMLDGPVGGAAFNNEFGRPNLAGYFRTYEQAVAGQMRGYHKPIMIAGGIGQIDAAHTEKRPLNAGALFIQLGGPGLLIGLGGGAASSMDTGANQETLDFDSVQRANAEIERRAQEVIDRCWQLGDNNPILSIHDVGAGGLSNALPELAHTGGVGAIFKLRAIPSEEPGMSPLQIWCNEAQERYVLAIAPQNLARLRAICERERCPFAVLGSAITEPLLRVEDKHFKNNPVDISLDVILGKAPKVVRDVKRVVPTLTPLDLGGINLVEAGYRVLALPTVADKTFLIAIGDRTVGGLTARDQMVGPWQIPVADVAVTLAGFNETSGVAYAMGERAPVAVIDAAASGRMAVGEALTNLAAAAIWDLGEVKLSANWMAAAGHPGEDAALFDTVHAVAMELCPALGISIPVGKDSLSMKTLWRDPQSNENKAVTAPLSLVISAFAPCTDVRQTLTPQLRTDVGDTVLVLIDLGNNKCRLGGSAFAQVYNQVGDQAPNVDDPRILKAFFQIVQRLNQDELILAYHDRSDGGLFATICEMMFAGHCGVTLWMDRFFDDFVLGDGQTPFDDRLYLLHLLFNEELGAVLQVKREHSPTVLRYCAEAGLANKTHVIGSLNNDDELCIYGVNGTVMTEPRISLQSAWSNTSFQMQRLRDNPDCAQQEFLRILDGSDPGLHVHLSYDVNEDIAAPFVIGKAKPMIAILREQGVNGQLEMAAAFDRAGFLAVDVHMSDVIAGRTRLKDFIGLAACGGFSYGDVLGAGEGWAKSILFNTTAREEFASFFQRNDTFALGVCNGCQMMSNLREIIPGAAHWPHFARNTSEQYEARFVMVEVQDSPSILLGNMAGSRMPIVVSHGEGRAEFVNAQQFDAAKGYVSLRFVDNYGAVTEKFPANSNGSPQGIAGLTTPDGRFTIMMPHPERVFRALQNSWRPTNWIEDSAWLKLFRNARKWVG